MIVGFIVKRYHICDEALSFNNLELKIYSTPIKALVAYFKETMKDTFNDALKDNNNILDKAISDCLYSIPQRGRGGITMPPEPSECTESMRLLGFEDGSELCVIPVYIEE
jgi:hypothetical protein